MRRTGLPRESAREHLTVGLIARSKKCILSRLSASHSSSPWLRRTRARQRSAVVSHRFEHDTRLDAAKSEGITKDITERLFARLVRHHVQVTSRIRGFKI